MQPSKVQRPPQKQPAPPEPIHADPRWPKDVRDALAAALRVSGPSRDSFFDVSRPVAVARAPGRLDVMGGFGDYSGSRVLEWPIAAAAVVMAQVTSDPQVVVRSLEIEKLGIDDAHGEVRLDLAALGPISEYSEFRSRLPSGPGSRWAAHALGAFGVLIRDLGARFDRGTRILIDSHVPCGKGVASSAAVEVATLLAVAAAHGVRLKPTQVPALAQVVENRVAGVPCGIMDQITACFGVSGAVLPIDCQAGKPLDPLPLPTGVELAGIDSGVRHDVGGDAYRTVRIGAAMGYRMIADLLKLGAKPAGSDKVVIHDPVLGGFLTNMGPSEFERKFAPRLPDRIDGKNFLDCFGGIVDREVKVDPAQEYQVRAAAAFPVYENFRARLFQTLLGDPSAAGRDGLWLMGELMLASHDGYSRSGLGHPGTDRLVELAMAEGPAQGIFGAKASGGGSGGTVVILHDRRGKTALSRIAAEYGRQTGKTPFLVQGASAGAMAFGVHQVMLSTP